MCCFCWRKQTKLFLGKGNGHVKSGSSSFQGACNQWDVQPASCSAGVAARVQPVPGFAGGERNGNAQRLPAKREQAAQGSTCKAD